MNANNMKRPKKRLSLIFRDPTETQHRKGRIN